MDSDRGRSNGHNLCFCGFLSSDWEPTDKPSFRGKPGMRFLCT